MIKLSGTQRKHTGRALGLLIGTATVASTCTFAFAESRDDDSLATPIAQQLAVPSYIHPNASPADWGRLATSTPGAVGIAVANVINGPDYTPLPEWASVIHATALNGVKVVGYVDTGYLGTTGQRTRLGSSAIIDWISQIERDVDAWYAFYGADLSGIFFDQGQNACGPTATSQDWALLYGQLDAYVKRAHPGALTVLNPGIAVPQCYEHSADVLVTFEGSYEAYTNDPSSSLTYTPLSWDPVDPKKIWHIVYGAATPDQMSTVMALSERRSAGYVYVTDDVLPNPYDRLPPDSYWLTEQTIATRVPNTALVPPNAPMTLDSTDYTGTSISMDWVRSIGVTSPVVAYDVLRDGVRIGSVPATQRRFTADNLSPLTTYVFNVVARDALGLTSASSNALSERTDQTYGDPPTSPSDVVTSSTGYTSTVLGWKPQGDRNGKPPIEAFVVRQNGRPILRLPGWAQSVTIGKLAPGSQYRFDVIAIDASGDASQPSSTVTVTTQVLSDGAMIGSVAVVDSVDQSSYSADFLVPFAFRRVFIATGDPTLPCWSTGSNPQVCAAFVIENARLLQYKGTGTDWQWSVVRDVVPTVNGSTYTWAISPSDIGSPPAGATVLFNANGYAPNTYCGSVVVCESVGPPLPYE